MIKKASIDNEVDLMALLGPYYNETQEQIT